MGDLPTPDEEGRLIELLIAHDEHLIREKSPPDTEHDRDLEQSGQHRIQLKKAKQCLDKLQQFAEHRNFPNGEQPPASNGQSETAVVPIGKDTPIDDVRKRSKAGHDADFAHTDVDDRIPGTTGDERPEPAEFAPRQDRLPSSIGRFKVLSQLGIGGFGIVFHAYDPKLKRDVALKILRPESLLTSANRLRFERESQLAAMLSHPAIVPVYETGVDGPIRYIVFGYVQGENLADWFNRFGQPLDPEHAADTMIRIADAVAEAHGRGILHRDLKPGNLLVQTDVSAGGTAPDELADRIHVADFGLAIDLEHSSSLTRSGTMIGTPVYIAPELISGQDKPSTASDVYSLGVILYELLAGQPPFQADSGLQMLRKIVEDVPPRIKSVRMASSVAIPSTRASFRKVPRDLEAICFKCLQKNPDVRYQSARELNLDLKRWVDGETVMARSVTAWSQVVRWAARKPVVASLLSAVTLLMLALALGGIWVTTELSKRNSKLTNSYFDSLVSRSQLTRQTDRAGRRTDSLDAITSAVALLPDMRGNDLRLLLRNEALANLNLVDMQIVSRIPFPKQFELSTASHEIAFDSRLQRVACPDGNGNVVVMDTSTGETRGLISIGGDRVRHLMFVPNSNTICGVVQGKDSSNLFVSRLEENSIGNSPVSETAIENIDPGFRIDCSDNGKSIVFMDVEGRIQIVDWKLRKNWTVLPANQERRSKGAAFSPSGKRLAVWGGNRVDVWTITDEHLPVEPEFQFEHTFNPGLGINSVAWSPNEERLATTTSVFSTHIWSTVWGASKHQVLGGHSGWVYHAVFDTSGKFLATSSSDNTTRYWNVETGESLMKAEGRTIATSSNGKAMAGCNSGNIVVWEILGPSFQENWTCDGSRDGCPLVATCGKASADGQYLMVCSETQVAIRDINSQKDLWTATTGGLNVAFSGDDKFGIATDIDRIIRVNLQTCDEQLILDLGDSGSTCGFVYKSLSVNYDGSLVAVATCDQQEMVDCETGDRKASKFQNTDRGFIRFHPKQPTFVVATEEGLEFWNYKTDQRIDFLAGSDYSDPVKFSPDGQYLVLHLEGKPVLLETQNKNIWPIAEFTTQLDYDDVAFSPDGNWMAVCGIGDQIRLIRLSDESPDRIREVARFPVTTSNTWVAFNSASNKLISADPDQRAYHWSIPDIRERLSGLGLNWAD